MRGSCLKFAQVVTLSAALFFTVTTVGDDRDSQVDPPLTCAGAFGRIVHSELLLGLAAAVIGPALAVETAGRLQGTPHLGYSIYFDLDNIIDQLNPSERSLLKDPKKNRNAIIQLFINRLNPDFHQPDNSFGLFDPRMASSYLDPKNPDKGVCRHKSVILAAILNYYGIVAVIEDGSVWNGSRRARHEWVYLPESDEVADPTWQVHERSDTYYNETAQVTGRDRGGITSWHLRNSGSFR